MIAVKTLGSFLFWNLRLRLVAIWRKFFLNYFHAIKVPIQVLPSLLDLRISVILISSWPLPHLDHLPILFNFSFILALVWIQYLDHSLLGLVALYLLVPLRNLTYLFLQQMTYGFMLLRSIHRRNAFFAIWFHFLRVKFSAIAKHTVRYVFIKVDVNTFDWSVLHCFARDCIWKRVVVLFLSSFFLSLILDSLALVLVVVYRLRDDVGEVVVEFAYFQACVLF